MYESAHDKTYKVAREPSEDSDQTGHPPSLIRVFAVRMKKLGSLATHWAHSEDWSDSGCPVWSESPLGANAEQVDADQIYVAAMWTQ